MSHLTRRPKTLKLHLVEGYGPFRLYARVPEGSRIPWGYGYAWWNYMSGSCTAIPIPFNILARWIRNIYYAIARWGFHKDARTECAKCKYNERMVIEKIIVEEIPMPTWYYQEQEERRAMTERQVMRWLNDRDMTMISHQLLHELTRPFGRSRYQAAPPNLNPLPPQIPLPPISPGIISEHQKAIMAEIKKHHYPSIPPQPFFKELLKLGAITEEQYRKIIGNII